MDLQTVHDTAKRLKLFILHHELTVYEFAQSIGDQRSEKVNRVLRALGLPSFDMLFRIKKAYPKIDLNWLVFGEGEMFLPEKKSTEETSILEENKGRRSINFDFTSFKGEPALDSNNKKISEPARTKNMASAKSVENSSSAQEEETNILEKLSRSTLEEKAKAMGPKKEDSPLKLAVDKKLLSAKLRNNYLKSFGNNGWLYQRNEQVGRHEMKLEVDEIDMEPTIKKGAILRLEMYRAEEVLSIAADPLRYHIEMPFFSAEEYGPYPTLLLIHPQLGFHLKRLVGLDDNNYLILEGDHKNAGRSRMKAQGAEFWIVKEIVEA